MSKITSEIEKTMDRIYDPNYPDTQFIYNKELNEIWLTRRIEDPTNETHHLKLSVDLKTGECATVCDPLLPVFMPEAMFTDKEIKAMQELAKKFEED